MLGRHGTDTLLVTQVMNHHVRLLVVALGSAMLLAGASAVGWPVIAIAFPTTTPTPSVPPIAAAPWSWTQVMETAADAAPLQADDTVMSGVPLGEWVRTCRERRRRGTSGGLAIARRKDLEPHRGWTLVPGQHHLRAHDDPRRAADDRCGRPIRQLVLGRRGHELSTRVANPHVDIVGWPDLAIRFGELDRHVRSGATVGGSFGTRRARSLRLARAGVCGGAGRRPMEWTSTDGRNWQTRRQFGQVYPKGVVEGLTAIVERLCRGRSQQRPRGRAHARKCVVLDGRPHLAGCRSSGLIRRADIGVRLEWTGSCPPGSLAHR